MNTDINIHLTPEAFTALQQLALATGRTPSEEAAAALEQKFRPAAVPAGTNGNDGSDESPRIEDFFGSIDMGYPIGIDNEQIDADLAREYGRGLDNR
jgi:hypothetical protein